MRGAFARTQSVLVVADLLDSRLLQCSKIWSSVRGISNLINNQARNGCFLRQGTIVCFFGDLVPRIQGHLQVWFLHLASRMLVFSVAQVSGTQSTRSFEYMHINCKRCVRCKKSGTQMSAPLSHLSFKYSSERRLQQITQETELLGECNMKVF